MVVRWCSQSSLEFTSHHHVLLMLAMEPGNLMFIQLCLSLAFALFYFTLYSPQFGMRMFTLYTYIGNIQFVI